MRRNARDEIIGDEITGNQIAMVRSCYEKRGRKLHEKNYDGRGQRTPQSKTTKEATGRHHTERHEVSPIRKEHTGDRKKWKGRIRVADPSPLRD